MDDQRAESGKFKAAYCYNVFKTLFDGDDSVKIECSSGAIAKNLSVVTLIGKNIMFNNPRWFLKIGRIASNFEVYPTADGTIKLAFAFYDDKEDGK